MRRHRPRLRPGLSRLATTAFLLLLGAGVVGTVGAFWRYQPVPPSLTPATALPEVALVGEPLDDARTVDLVAQLGPGARVVAPAGGVVTATACRPGAVLESGTGTFTLSGSVLVNLHTTTPLWRSLKAGDRGPDVSALQRELVRLGWQVRVTGRFDRQTWRAWDRLVERHGGDTETGRLAVEQVVWLLEPTVPVESCPALLGATVTAGQELVTPPQRLLSGRLKQIPSNLLPGPRRLVVDEVEVALDEAGNLTPSGLAALAGTGLLARHRANPDNHPLRGEYALAQPLTVYPLPPAAIAMRDRSTGCVRLADGHLLAVQVTVSRLGRTYVTLADQPTVARVRAAAEEGMRCE